LEGNVLTLQSYQSFVNVALKLKRDVGGVPRKSLELSKTDVRGNGESPQGLKPAFFQLLTDGLKPVPFKAA